MQCLITRPARHQRAFCPNDAVRSEAKRSEKTLGLRKRFFRGKAAGDAQLGTLGALAALGDLICQEVRMGDEEVMQELVRIGDEGIHQLDLGVGDAAQRLACSCKTVQ